MKNWKTLWKVFFNAWSAPYGNVSFGSGVAIYFVCDRINYVFESFDIELPRRTEKI